ncbi:MAG: hypothetical protein HDT26_01840 [Subdoligranulum sp.]|nr:hypothetical protein [Subdoligranulum sp.]
MANLWTSLANSGVFLAVLAGGYLLKRLGLFQREDAKLLSKIIMNITLPAAIVKGFAGVEFSGALLLTFLFSCCVSAALLGTAALLSRGKTPVERGTTVLNTNTFNCGNFAIPLLSPLVGADAFAAMCMFDVGAALFTYGPNTALAHHVMGDGEGKTTPGSILKRVFRAPVMIVYLALIALSLLHWELPEPVMRVAVMAGNANSFLAMLCIGILFEVRFPKEGRATVLRVLGGRCAVCAAAALLAWFVLPVPREMARALVVILFAPVANCAAMITVENGCDGTVAAVINSASMVLSTVLMTLLLAVLPG